MGRGFRTALVVGLPLLLSWAIIGAGDGGAWPAFRASGGFGPGVMNHPVRVVPSDAVAIPPSWPLDHRGAITCLTCHVQIPADDGNADSMLRGGGSRRPQPGEFCAHCHQQGEIARSRAVHWRVVGVAHVSADRSGTGFQPWKPASETHGTSEFDAHTRQCLSCHDGATATESGNTFSDAHRSRAVGDRDRDHPVGVEYGRRSRPKGCTPLRPAPLLPAHVLLPDGKVGCVSCHDLYAQSRYLLTVPIRDSQLCLTCHDMG